MALSAQTTASAGLADSLPSVYLKTRNATYALDTIDFLIGAVPGCDLRVGDAAGVCCLIARHPAGVTLRKLSPTQTIFVNGKSVTHCELADGDRVQIGSTEIAFAIKHVLPGAISPRRVDGVQERGDLLDRERALEAKLRQHDADVLRLNRLQSEHEARAAEVNQRIEDWTQKRHNLQRDIEDFQAQLLQVDEWRAKLADEAERLAKQKQEQDDATRQLADRAAALEGQQATLAMLRGRMERMRDDMRSRQTQLDDQAVQQGAKADELTRREQDVDTRLAELQAQEQQYASDREQWTERSAILEAAVRQLKTAQQELVAEQERVRTGAQKVEEDRRQHVEAESVLTGRLQQLAESQQRLDIERQALRDRGVALVEREEACRTLQEQLHRRTDEIAARHKEITERLQEYQTRFAKLDERSAHLDQRDLDLQAQVETWQRELAEKAELLKQQHLHVTSLDGEQQDQVKQLAALRKAHDDERAQFLQEQQAAQEKLAQARAELDAMKGDVRALIAQLPDAEVRAGAAVERIGNAREQLRNYLGEIHEYVRQCQDELTQLRSRLQTDLDGLSAQEETLRRNQDEHRLAVVAYRQQLIDWQAQIADLKRVLARDESRLERREAQVDERARAMEAESLRLTQEALNLVEQEREVADRREQMDQHLVDMRDWYRKKLRDLAGIPLIPDTLEPAIVSLPAREAGDQTLPSPSGRGAGEQPLPSPSGRGAGGEGGSASDSIDDPGIIPTSRSILSITNAADAGDRALGKLLRDSQLIDADTLTALLAEARRQRRSLRQVLLASGVITLYQLALIEAGNVDGLMLGPVRVIDRLRHNTHETVYRVFDPRRGVEAVLRHLSEADAADAVKPDEFRQRFTQVMLNDPHVANTLELLDLTGRPAVLQEWLSGLPATDWPPLAAAPGVCYRLLTQAAQGLAAAHQAGAVHGHLSDALLMLTPDGVLKIRGFGEPPWLIGTPHDDEPTVQDDLRMLGKIVSGWCTPSGVRKGAKTKPLPEALVSILYKLAANGSGYRDAKALLDDLQGAAASIPPNAEAWDRLVKYVRDHGTPDAMLRQSA